MIGARAECFSRRTASKVDLLLMDSLYLNHSISSGYLGTAPKSPQSVHQTRGDMLADLCRFVDFIRFLDCSMPLGV
jgi:hypothetical protein